MAKKDISRTLIVGLGGTGQTVICDIKKRMLRTYGEIPPLVKFLEFDTDDPKNDDGTPFKYYYDGQSFEDFKYRIERNEFLKIPSPGMGVIKEDRTCTEKLDIDKLAAVSARMQGHGAGGFRVVGRAHFLNGARDIINTLNNTVNALRSASLSTSQQARGYNVGNGGISVYVIASLAGGTGSSAFQDMSRMLQKAGVNVQYSTNAGMDKIFGVFFLPKFFEGKPNTSNIFMNAYTALSELDYTFDLADPTRHSPQSREVQDDKQDYNNYPSQGERVIYDAIYLIDSLTSRGNVHTLPEASNYVASFIAGSIAADSTALTSSYVNSQHKMNNVRGKFQNYSSLGYCELRFNRQELVKYLLNRKLLGYLQQFKTGTSNTTSNLIVEEFLNNNRLNEGVMVNLEGQDTRAQQNELIDTIIDMTDRRLTGASMAAVATGKDAAAGVETSKTRYLTNIGTVAQEMVRDFANKKSELLQKLRNLLDDHMTGLGFGAFPDLAMYLKGIIADMKKGLEDELEQHETQFTKIDTRELRLLKTTIEENSSSGFLGFGNKLPIQQGAITQYLNKVRFDTSKPQNPTLAWLKVETIRKREAVAVFEEMLNIIDTYYKEDVVETVNGSQTNVTGAYNTVHSLYRVLKEQLIRENNNYRPSKAAVNETVFADAYFKEYFEQHDADNMALNQQATTALNEYIASVFAEQPQVNEATLAAMRNKLLSLLPADGLIRKIQSGDLSIDQLFIACYGNYGDIANNRDLEANPQLKLLGQVNTLFETLWSYLNFRGQGMDPERNMVVGAYDAADNIFRNHGYQASIDGWNRYEYVSLGDPDRIAFMLLETAIPAFKLMGVDRWANDYELHKQDVYTFTDKRMENIDMIKPGMHEDAEIAWAYGWLFGLISNPKNKQGLRVKPTHEYASAHNIILERGGTYNYFATLRHSSNIYDCYQKFVNDNDLSRDIYDQCMDILDRDPIGNIIKLKQWVNDGQMWAEEVRGKKDTFMADEERKVIQDEVDSLEKRFVRLGFGLTLNNGKVNHPYSEALDQREQELKKKTEA
jgi:hypothetical protein